MTLEHSEYNGIPETVHVEFTSSEISRLLLYGEKVYSSGHWGNGALFTPEEQVLHDLLKASEGPADLTTFNIKLICIWIREFTDTGYVLSGEDISVLSKIYSAMKKLYASKKERFDLEVESLEKRMDEVLKIFDESGHQGASGKGLLPDMVVSALKKYFENSGEDSDAGIKKIVDDRDAVSALIKKYFRMEKNYYIASLNMIEDVIAIIDEILPEQYR